MRIALVCPYAWEAAGGVQVHVKSLAARLLEREHEAIVLTPTTEAPSEPWVRSVGRSVRVPYRGTVAQLAPLSYRRVRSVLASFRPDVVHVHEPLTPSASMYATLVANAPVVATVHAYLDRSVAMEMAAPILRRIWRRVTVGIAGSDAAASFLRRAVPDAALDIVPNGVDVGAFAAAGPRADLPPGRRILWVNRLDPQKGFPIALAAFSKVLAEVPAVFLVVVGAGRDREALGLLTESERARVDMRGAGPNDLAVDVHEGCFEILKRHHGDDRSKLLLSVKFHAHLHRKDNRRIEQSSARRSTGLVDHARSLRLGVIDELRHVVDLAGLGKRRDAHSFLPWHADLKLAELLNEAA